MRASQMLLGSNSQQPQSVWPVARGDGDRQHPKEYRFPDPDIEEVLHPLPCTGFVNSRLAFT